MELSARFFRGSRPADPGEQPSFHCQPRLVSCVARTTGLWKPFLGRSFAVAEYPALGIGQCASSNSLRYPGRPSIVSTRMGTRAASL